MEIREFMKTEVVRLRAKATVRDAARLVVEKRIGTLPVVDDEDKLIGVFGHGRLLRLVMPAFAEMIEDIDFVHDFGAFEHVRPAAATLARPVTELMREPVSVESNCGLVRAFTVMRKMRLYDLPVVDDSNRLVGLASRVDVARAILSTWEGAPDAAGA